MEEAPHAERQSAETDAPLSDVILPVGLGCIPGYAVVFLDNRPYRSSKSGLEYAPGTAMSQVAGMALGTIRAIDTRRPAKRHSSDHALEAAVEASGAETTRCDRCEFKVGDPVFVPDFSDLNLTYGSDFQERLVPIDMLIGVEHNVRIPADHIRMFRQVRDQLA